MRRREGLIQTTIFLIILSGFLYILAGTAFLQVAIGNLAYILNPLRLVSISGLSNLSGGGGEYENDFNKRNDAVLNRVLTTSQLKEMQALRDQFNTSDPKSQTLLPARIVGMRNFIPGVSTPTAFVLDRGKKNNVKVGMAVVYKDNLIGKVTKTSNNLSEVQLLLTSKISLTARTLETEASGIVKKDNESLVLQNVILSETLNEGDIVVTTGDVDLQGIGVPPDLLIGEIVSVDKKQSSLFQSAQLKQSVDPTKLTYVFVITSLE